MTISDMGLFIGDDEVTVRTQQLDIVSLPKRYLTVESNSVFPLALECTAAVDVVELQTSSIIETAACAGASFGVEGSVLPFPVAPSSGFSAEFAETVRVLLLPLFVVSAVKITTVGFAASVGLLGAFVLACTLAFLAAALVVGLLGHFVVLRQRLFGGARIADTSFDHRHEAILLLNGRGKRHPVEGIIDPVETSVA